MPGASGVFALSFRFQTQPEPQFAARRFVFAKRNNRNAPVNPRQVTEIAGKTPGHDIIASGPLIGRVLRDTMIGMLIVGCMTHGNDDSGGFRTTCAGDTLAENLAGLANAALDAIDLPGCHDPLCRLPVHDCRARRLDLAARGGDARFARAAGPDHRHRRCPEDAVARDRRPADRAGDRDRCARTLARHGGHRWREAPAFRRLSAAERPTGPRDGRFAEDLFRRAGVGIDRCRPYRQRPYRTSKRAGCRASRRWISSPGCAGRSSPC